jgi:hypothetical protein
VRLCAGGLRQQQQVLVGKRDSPSPLLLNT